MKNKAEPEYVRWLKEIFHSINNNAERLNSFDLWDTEIMAKINRAEINLRNAMQEIIEIIGEDMEITLQIKR